MYLFDLIHSFLLAQVGTRCTLFTDSTCPGSSFNAITAAFATQGYWVQADILHYLHFGVLTTLPALIYILAAAGGLISMALGSPPKMYLWFFMGPPIFHWLVDTTWPVHGVKINVGRNSSLYGIPTEGAGGIFKILDRWNATLAQVEVWKMAEPGLLNTNIVRRDDYVTSTYTEPLGGPNGDGTVEAAWFFVYFDSFVSGMVEWLTEWTGVFNLNSGGDYSSIIEDPLGALNKTTEPHYLARDLKWKMLEEISSAKLASVDLRSAFVTFMQSECGDVLTQAVSKENFAAAMSSTGEVPGTIFSGILNPSDDEEYRKLINGSILRNFAQQEIPTPYSIKRFYLNSTQLGKGVQTRDNGIGSFENANDLWKADTLANPNGISLKFNEERIDCAFYLRFLIDAFRWEAAHIYYQMITQVPAGMTPKTLVYNLFYGWPGRDDIAGKMPVHVPGVPGSLYVLNTEKQQHFLKDLILVHLFKNEMLIAPKPYITRTPSSKETISYAFDSAKTIGQKSRFSELYTWATMLPYIQGLLLYILAIAYPIICCFIVMPGMHKILFTWMSFFIWAKLWDFGFALVAVLERTVWASVGNRSEIGEQFGRIYKMAEYGHSNVMCPTNAKNVWESAKAVNIPGIPSSLLDLPFAVCGGAAVPNVTLETVGKTAQENFANAVRLFDSSFVLAGNLDLDISNAWYIYIMAALYFAVPALTGQLVLGAKAGAASMIGTMIGSQAQEAGKAAAQAYSAQFGQAMNAAAMDANQTAKAKSLRDPNGAAGIAMRGALEAGNKALMNESLSGAASTASQLLGNKLSAGQAGLSRMQSGQGLNMAILGSYPKQIGDGLMLSLAGLTGAQNAMPAGLFSEGSDGKLTGINLDKLDPTSKVSAGGLIGGPSSSNSTPTPSTPGATPSRGMVSSSNGVSSAGNSNGTTQIGYGSSSSQAGIGASGSVSRGGQAGVGASGSLGQDIMAMAGYGPSAPSRQIASSLMNFASGSQGANLSAGIQATQSMYGVQGFESGRLAAGSQSARQNYWQPSASYAASENTFGQVAPYVTGLAGVAAARGTSAPSLPQKPMDEQQFAAGGLLGSGMQEAARWGDPEKGGYGTWVGNSVNNSGIIGTLNDMGGSDAVLQTYQQYGGGASLGQIGSMHERYMSDLGIKLNSGQNAYQNNANNYSLWGATSNTDPSVVAANASGVQVKINEKPISNTVADQDKIMNYRNSAKIKIK